MCSSPRLWFCAFKTATLALELLVLWAPDLTFPFVQSKRRDLHQNIKSIMVPALICGIVLTKQRLLDRNNKSLRVPDKTCRFVHGKQQL